MRCTVERPSNRGPIVEIYSGHSLSPADGAGQAGPRICGQISKEAKRTRKANDLNARSKTIVANPREIPTEDACHCHWIMYASTNSQPLWHQIQASSCKVCAGLVMVCYVAATLPCNHPRGTHYAAIATTQLPPRHSDDITHEDHWQKPQERGVAFISGGDSALIAPT